jgi:creatinine amidohydrolase
MRWEHLTVPGFEKAVGECEGVCILPVGVIEPHASHLPLGQDTMACRWAACRAAEVEPAIVFPWYPWGINHEGAHLPGAMVLKRDLAMALLENVCDEIARNGLKKIIILSGHGGNRFLLPLFVQTATERKRNYSVYLARIPHLPEETAHILETTENGHAGESETSTALHMYPELVDLDSLPPEPHPSRKRLKHLKDTYIYSTVDWYSMYPTMYTGDATPASPEKGKIIKERHVELLVEAIRAVKQDTVTDALLDEFMRAQEHPKSAY